MLMRSRTFLAVSSILVLAACSAEKTASAPGDPALSASLRADGEALRPGLYHIVQTGDVEMEEERCILTEDIAAERFATPASIGNGWTVNTNRMSDGIIKVVARHPTGSQLNFAGSFERESFVIDATLDMKVNGETHIVRTKQRGRFTSTACPDNMV